MSLAIIFSRARIGIEAPIVTIEVHLSNGLPSFTIVGLPETTVRESKDRVRSAIINSGLEFPQRRITVNLAPADLPKEGGRFDLAIAMGILAASKQISDKQLYQYEFLGELGLNGDIRPIVGEIPSALACLSANRTCILPQSNAIKATIIEKALLLSANSLFKVVEHFKGGDSLTTPEQDWSLDENLQNHGAHTSTLDMSDVIGQPMAKRALEIAAAGQHNLLFLGPPGTGKSMLARRLSTILPPLTDEQALQSAAVNSISGKPFNFKHWRERPFRAPHHTSTAVALTGGGRPPRPGEISLAHHGVLFLDELPEFSRYTLDALREPLETGNICISRASLQVEFPAQFQLIAALNPSPTGHHMDGRCTSEQVLKYLSRISSPFLDRIDLQIEVPALPKGTLSTMQSERLDKQGINTDAVTHDPMNNVDIRHDNQSESSASIACRVLAAREIMMKRAGKPNALLSSKETAIHCALSFQDTKFLEDTLFRFKMSIRAYHKILKVARTIADLNGEAQIARSHIAEALGYRSMERLLRHLSL